MLEKKISENYKSFYNKKTIGKLFPTEFIVRSFLGNYNNLNKLDRKKLISKKVLDLGCGDGRNIPFLNYLGFSVYGLEINKEIINFCGESLIYNDSKANLVVGSNSKIPFNESFFDFIIACHSCYYIAKNQTFIDNIKEVSRVLKKGGRFIFSVPKDTSYLVKGSEILNDNHAIIKKDPLEIRNGSKIKFFVSKKEIISYIGLYFDSIEIGSCENDWWGNQEFCWTVVCNSK